MPFGLVASHHKTLNVCLVPEGEVNLGVLNGSYLESRPSEFKRQGLPGALSGPTNLGGERRSSTRNGRSDFRG